MLNHFNNQDYYGLCSLCLYPLREGWLYSIDIIAS